MFVEYACFQMVWLSMNFIMLFSGNNCEGFAVSCVTHLGLLTNNVLRLDYNLLRLKQIC